MVQSAHSTEHAILQISSQISNSFNGKQFTLGVFIDFWLLNEILWYSGPWNTDKKNWKIMEYNMNT